MTDFRALNLELGLLQSKTIGLFKAYAGGGIELVVEDNSDQLTTIHIGDLGGFHETHIPKSKGLYKRFPDNKSLYEFKDDTFALYNFCKPFETNYRG